MIVHVGWIHSAVDDNMGFTSQDLLKHGVWMRRFYGSEVRSLLWWWPTFPDPVFECQHFYSVPFNYLKIRGACISKLCCFFFDFSCPGVLRVSIFIVSHVFDWSYEWLLVSTWWHYPQPKKCWDLLLPQPRKCWHLLPPNQENTDSCRPTRVVKVFCAERGGQHDAGWCPHRGNMSGSHRHAQSLAGVQ